MKKLLMALLILSFTIAAAVCADAGVFSDYYDFEQPDGTYAYAFPRVLVPMDELWYQKTRVVPGEDGESVSFCHEDSYNAYAAEGLDGGKLFTIGASEDTGFRELPDVVYLGFDEEEETYYYALLPTDYQAYAEDEEISAEYDTLWSGVLDVLAGIQIKGSVEFRNIHPFSDGKPVESEPRILISQGYKCQVNVDGKTVTIIEYTGDQENIVIPSEIDGYQVRDIGYQAFTYRKMDSLNIPDSVRRIGERAFEYCVIRENFRLPEGVTIQEDAFSYAELPPVIEIPAGTFAEENAFSYCEALRLIFIGPDSSLQRSSFGYCRDLEQIVCADGCRLKENAFEYGSDLKTVYLCGNPEVDNKAFFACGDYDVSLKEENDYDLLMDKDENGVISTELLSDPAEDDVERELQILSSPVSADGVTVTLEKALAGRSENGGFRYTLEGTIENTSDEGIMQVVYSFAFTDVNGEEYRSFSITYDGEDTAIPPHGTVSFSHDDIRWGPQSVPAAVSLGIKEVKTETELPPAHIPKTGEYLYKALDDEKLANIRTEAPAELSFHVDQGGYGQTATFREGAELEKAVDLLCGIKIGEESNEWVTDNYNWISVVWKDGTSSFISINLYNLEYFIHSSPHTWNLENLDEFWSFAAGYLEED